MAFGELYGFGSDDLTEGQSWAGGALVASHHQGLPVGSPVSIAHTSAAALAGTCPKLIRVPALDKERTSLLEVLVVLETT